MLALKSEHEKDLAKIKKENLTYKEGNKKLTDQLTKMTKEF